MNRLGALQGDKVRRIPRVLTVPLLVLALSGTAVLAGAGPAIAAPPPPTITLTACHFITASNCPTLASGSGSDFGATVALEATLSPVTEGTTVTFHDVGVSSIYGAGDTKLLGTAVTSDNTTAPGCGTGIAPSPPPCPGLAILKTEFPFFNTNTITATALAGTSNAVNIVVNVSVANHDGTLLINEVRPWGPSGAGDNYIQIYDNTTGTNEQVPLAGWRIENTAGTSQILTLPSNAPSLLPRQTYLITGPGYSLGSVSTGDDTWADMGSTTGGVFAFALIAPDGNGTITDTVGTAGSILPPVSGTTDPVPDTTDLLALVPPASFPSAQWTWDRLYKLGAPQDTLDNNTDFLLVSNTSAVVGAGTLGSGSLAPALGAPSPESSTSPYQQNESLKSKDLVGAGNADAPNYPNRIYVKGTPGSLVIQRTITNSSNFNICGIQVMVTSMSELNGGPQPNVTIQPTRIADLKMMGPGYVSAGPTTLANDPPLNPTSEQVANLSPTAPFPTTDGGGQNSLLVVPYGGNYSMTGGLPRGDSINVSFTFEVDTLGEFWFGYNVMSFTSGATPLTSTCPAA